MQQNDDLDVTDSRLLAEVQRNATLTAQELGERLNLSASQDGLDLVLNIGGTGTLTIDGFFEQNQTGAYTVGSIVLDDDTTLDVADILALIGVTADPIVIAP